MYVCIGQKRGLLNWRDLDGEVLVKGPDRKEFTKK